MERTPSVSTREEIPNPASDCSCKNGWTDTKSALTDALGCTGSPANCLASGVLKPFTLRAEPTAPVRGYFDANSDGHEQDSEYATFIAAVNAYNTDLNFFLEEQALYNHYPEAARWGRLAAALAGTDVDILYSFGFLGVYNYCTDIADQDCAQQGCAAQTTTGTGKGIDVTITHNNIANSCEPYLTAKAIAFLTQQMFYLGGVMIQAASVGETNSSPYGDTNTYFSQSCERCPCPENQPWLFTGQGNYNDMMGGMMYMRGAAANLLADTDVASTMTIIGGMYDIYWQGVDGSSADGTAGKTSEDNVDPTFKQITSDMSMHGMQCSYAPQSDFGTSGGNWENCADPMLLGGCTRHMECMDNEFCMDCTLCSQFQGGEGSWNGLNTEFTATGYGKDALPLCGACTAGLSVATNPTTVDGRTYNSAKSVTATCAPRRPFLDMFGGSNEAVSSGALKAFGIDRDNSADNVNDNIGNCIQNCPKEGLDAIAIYDLDTFTG